MTRTTSILAKPTPADAAEYPSDWYASLVDDCRAVLTEHLFNSRLEQLEAYHAIGARVWQTKEVEDKYGKRIVKNLAHDLGMSERRLYQAIQLYAKYPDLNALPFGKDLSASKVFALLPDGKDWNGRFPITRRSLLTADLTAFDAGLRHDVELWRTMGDDLVAKANEIVQDVQNVTLGVDASGARFKPSTSERAS